MRNCLATCLLFTIHTVIAGELAGPVVAITDGDTLTVLISRKQIRVRLVDIDAPEKKQPFGTRSRQSLSEICGGKVARVDDRGKDRYAGLWDKSPAQVSMQTPSKSGAGWRGCTCDTRRKTHLCTGFKLKREPRGEGYGRIPEGYLRGSGDEHAVRGRQSDQARNRST